MIASLLTLVGIIWLCVKRPTMALILNSLLFIFLTKLLSAIYVGDDQAYFSSESELEILSSPLALNIYGLSLALTFFVIFKAINFQKINCSYKDLNLEIYQWAGKFFFISLFIFIGFLFYDLFNIGLIPAFDCIERYDYLRNYANASHKFLIKYLPMISFSIGLYYVHLKSLKKFNLIHLFPILLFFVYLLLTSNRFSAFFQVLSFSVIPISIYYFHNKINPRIIIRKSIIKILFTSFLVFIFLGLLNSYVLQRDQNSKCYISSQNNQQMPNSIKNFKIDKEIFNRVKEKIVYRSLIQPLDLYLLTFHRIVAIKDWKPEQAFSIVFDIDKVFEGNRSIRYLMNINLDKERSLFLEKIHNQFGGGYPEILIELFGIWGMWPAIILFAYITGMLIRKLIYTIRDQHFFSSFLTFYIFYAFFNFYVGGMINFLIAWTFWIKVFALFLALKIEPLIISNKKSLSK